MRVRSVAWTGFKGGEHSLGPVNGVFSASVAGGNISTAKPSAPIVVRTVGAQMAQPSGRRTVGWPYFVTTSLPFMIPEWPGNEQKKL